MCQVRASCLPSPKAYWRGLFKAGAAKEVDSERDVEEEEEAESDGEVLPSFCTS